MKSSFMIQNLDNVEATLIVTMRVEEWRQILKQLDTKWPSWKFGEAIVAMITAFNKNFEGVEEM